MINFSNQRIPVPCPGCGHVNSIIMKHVMTQATITCSCGKRIQLQDENGSVKKGVANMDRALKDFSKTLKRLSR